MQTQDSAGIVSSAPMQVLSFVLNDECFGVEISSIQEVLEYCAVTPVPRTPAFMLGVLNLRGKVIPVVDLRRHFDMHLSETTVDTCIVILHVEIDAETTTLGVLADRVKEVVEISAADISPAPRIGNRINSSFIHGMARYDGEFIILLNLSRVFSSDELQRVIDQTVGSEPGQQSDSVSEDSAE